MSDDAAKEYYGPGPIVAVEEPGHEHLSCVRDIDVVAAAIDESWNSGAITADMEALFVGVDGTPVLRIGDEIKGYSTPGVEARRLPGGTLEQ